MQQATDDVTSGVDVYRHPIDPQGLIITLTGREVGATAKGMPPAQLMAAMIQANQNAESAFEAAQILGKVAGFIDPLFIGEGDFQQVGQSVQFLVNFGLTLRRLADEAKYELQLRSETDAVPETQS